MDTTLSLETIYNMLQSLSIGNKKWLADHLYADIRQSQGVRSKEQMMSDMESCMLEAREYKDGRIALKTVDELMDEL